MSASIASPETLLNRIFTLREFTPFILTTDSLYQRHHKFTDLAIRSARAANSKLSITFLSFSTPATNKPAYITDADIFIPLYKMSLQEQQQNLIKLAPSNEPTSGRGASKIGQIIVIDNLNMLASSAENMVSLLKLLINPHRIVYGVYHLDIPGINESSTPNSFKYLEFLSSVIYDVKPVNADDVDSPYIDQLNNPNPTYPYDMKLPPSSNKYWMDLSYRRKSGREVIHRFEIADDVWTQVKEEEEKQDDEELLDGLTTFNLGTNEKQKKQREQVELPFMEAQQSLGSVGSAIVYTFEKDDDYDEEDPYEDPF